MSAEGGRYAVEIHLLQEMTVRVGQLGTLSLQAGAYVYVGSARRGLAARLNRHARAAKPLRWHIDYLTAHAPARRAALWPLTVGECELARCLQAAGGVVVPGFGSSDCRCGGHLLYLGGLTFERLIASAVAAGLPPALSRQWGADDDLRGV
jgi:sugar fermentation stimulation protein A